MNPFKILNKRYPLNVNRLKTALFISLFIAFFLFVFQPFGLTFWHTDYKGIKILGYGMVSFVVMSIHFFVFPRIFKRLLSDDNWTVWKQIVWIAALVINISIANYFYSAVLHIFDWSGWQGLAIFVTFTFLVSIIPIVVISIISHNLYLKKNLESSKLLNEQLNKLPQTLLHGQNLSFYSDNNKIVLQIHSSDFIYAEAAGNYATIFFVQNSEINRLLIRNTFKSIEIQLAGCESALKVHRAFIVNVQKIEKVSGNSQGYRLKLQHCENEIPVARSFNKNLKEAVNSDFK